MLRYPFYRRPAVILENFGIRLRYVAGYNLLVGLAICATALVAVSLVGGEAPDLTMGTFCLSVLLLAVFFSVHHLFLYYVFQPYTTDLTVKNPLYKALHLAVYIASFICYQVRTAGMAFAMGVLVITVAYTAVALLLVYRLSPRYFRVK